MTPKPAPKRHYVKPVVQRLGHVAALTAGGSAGQMENTGNDGMSGPAFRS